jgi:hypothetical protein
VVVVVVVVEEECPGSSRLRRSNLSQSIAVVAAGH